MPRLPEDQRQFVNTRIARHQQIKETFKGRQYTSQHCHLCNWASNGQTLDDAVTNNREHEAAHPEWAEWVAATIPAQDLLDSIHDHDCDMRNCVCKCGCQQGPFCILIFGGLCSVCQIRDQRGDESHGNLTEPPTP